MTAIFEATHFYFSSYTGLKGGGVVMSQAAASAARSLPPVISEYLAASDRGDTEAVVRCFAEDAVVVDEGREWRGAGAPPSPRPTSTPSRSRGRRRWARRTAPSITTCTSIWKAISPAARLT